MQRSHKFQKLCQALSEMPISSVFHNTASASASGTKALHLFHSHLTVIFFSLKRIFDSPASEQEF